MTTTHSATRATSSTQRQNQQQDCCGSCCGRLFRDWTQWVTPIPVMSGGAAGLCAIFVIQGTNGYVVGGAVAVSVLWNIVQCLRTSCIIPEKNLENTTRDLASEDDRFDNIDHQLGDNIKNLTGVLQLLHQEGGAEKLDTEKLKKVLADTLAQLQQRALNLAKTEQELETLRDEFGRFQTTMDGMDEANRSFGAQAAAYRAGVDEEMGLIHQQGPLLMQHVQEIGRDVQALTTGTKGVKDTTGLLQKTIPDIRSAHAQVKREAEMLASQIATLSHESGNLSSNLQLVSKLKDDIASIQAKIGDYDPLIALIDILLSDPDLMARVKQVVDARFK